MESTYKRRVAAALVAVATVALSAATLALAGGLGTSPIDFLDQHEANQWLGGFVIPLIGAAIIATGRNRLGPILAALGLMSALVGTAQEWAVFAHRDGLALAGAAAWVATYCWIPGLIGTLVAVPVLFPDGQLPSPRWRVPAGVAVAVVTVAFVLGVTAQEPLDEAGFPWLHNPLDLPPADGTQMAVGSLLMAIAALISLAASLRIVLRIRGLHGIERSQSALFALTMLLILASFATPSLPVSFALNLLGFALLGAAIARYRLFDIQLYLPRAIAYALCVGAAIIVYLLATTLTTRHDGSGFLPALATAIAALASARVLDRLHRAIGRALFGDRSRPDEALAALGGRLSAALGPDEVLRATVDGVCGSLRLPFAEVQLEGSDRTRVSTGEPPRRTVGFELNHAGENVGTLTVGLRPGERNLAEVDRRVLTRFAHQVAVAAHGVKATYELRSSREEVVVARESERQRLHRDLHDGIGPALAGITLGLETAGRVVLRDPDNAARLIHDLREEASTCIDDLRRVIADLRPPLLDELGLVGAMTQHAEHLNTQSGGQLTITVRSHGTATGLPPAVEVAAYRIAAEALTNLARHSGASRGEVELVCDTHLRLEVRDNGAGLPPHHVGTGLASMRQRAEELGGTCTATFVPGSGVTVATMLPLLTQEAS